MDPLSHRGLRGVLTLGLIGKRKYIVKTKDIGKLRVKTKIEGNQSISPESGVSTPPLTFNVCGAVLVR